MRAQRVAAPSLASVQPNVTGLTKVSPAAAVAATRSILSRRPRGKLAPLTLNGDACSVVAARGEALPLSSPSGAAAPPNAGFWAGAALTRPVSIRRPGGRIVVVGAGGCGVSFLRFTAARVERLPALHSPHTRTGGCTAAASAPLLCFGVVGPAITTQSGATAAAGSASWHAGAAAQAAGGQSAVADSSDPPGKSSRQGRLVVDGGSDESCQGARMGGSAASCSGTPARTSEVRCEPTGELGAKDSRRVSSAATARLSLARQPEGAAVGVAA